MISKREHVTNVEVRIWCARDGMPPERNGINKHNHRRIWIVLCRRTRQLLAFFIGDGSMMSCLRLWRKLPAAYQGCHNFSDLWRAYHALPQRTHALVGKAQGQTNHIERLNNTLRQRLSRLVRKVLSFYKLDAMLNLHFKLFAYHYNLHHYQL